MITGLINQDAIDQDDTGVSTPSRVAAFCRRVLTNRTVVSTPQQPAAVPHDMRVYAIGDVHGRIDLLDMIIAHIDADLADRPHARPMLVFLGDYVDRGAHSFYVLERLIEVRQARPTVCLMGNHDFLFSRFIDDPSTLPAWAALGGFNTLMSYGLKPPPRPTAADGAALAQALATVMPKEHVTFLHELQLTAVCGDYAFVHAGIRPSIPLDQQIADDVLWIREEFLGFDKPHEHVIVHGHTPVIEPDIRNNRINIDTGAYATGRLTCLVLEGTDRRFLVSERAPAAVRSRRPASNVV